MGALWKRITEPEFRLALSAAVHLSLGVALCAMAQTLSEIIRRIEAESDLRFGFSTQLEQFNWDRVFGHPWVGLCIGICAGIAWNLIDRVDPQSRNQAVDRMVATAQGKKNERFPFQWTKFLLFGFVFFLCIPLPLTYFFHISMATYLPGLVAANNGLVYVFRRDIFTDACARLNSMELEYAERKKVNEWFRRTHKTAVGELIFSAFMIVFIATGATYISNDIWNKFREAEKAHAKHASSSGIDSEKSEGGAFISEAVK